IYSTDYGTEIEQALSQKTRRTLEAELERAITESLLAVLRTERVTDYAFEWEGDVVKVSFTAVPVIGPPERMEV
ncbi:DUF2634 domain-containing protein, partial [Carboxydocella sp. ULO1]|uniref:DUF2634 domain-containing protein n=1 Tax=Carboxydocella sp. ULO1 TaxID=1926599 RepID=UPI0009D28AD9